MKINNLIYAGVLMIAVIMMTSSCEKKYMDDYEPYSPSSVSASSIGLDYGSPVETYPVSGVILSDTPSFNIDGVYKFAIDTVYASPEATFNYARFGINAQSGVISYDNTTSTISPGSYYVNIAVININGVVFIDSVFMIKVLDVPVTVTANPDHVVTDALASGVISQLTYEVTGNPDPPVSSVSYSIVPSVTGFSVNTDGEVIKASNTELGEHVLSFKISTNYGDKVFDGLLTVTVEGSAPTLQYVQLDGASPLTRVTVSPWTAYTTHPPVLGGINGESWELIIPGGSPQQLIDALSIAAEGSISIGSDSHIPEGEYTIGVRVFASGTPFDFNGLFTIRVETRWDETPVLMETFDYALSSAEPLEPPFSSYTVNNGVPDKSFMAINYTRESPVRDLHSARLFYGKDGSYDVAMVLTVAMEDSWRNLRIQFGEFFGYGAAALALFERTLWYSYDNEAINGTFTPGNWIPLMAKDDPDWLTENLWNATDPFYDGDLPLTPYKELSGLDPDQNEVFICWHYFTEGSPDTGSQWFIDDVSLQASRAFTAEEE